MFCISVICTAFALVPADTGQVPASAPSVPASVQQAGPLAHASPLLAARVAAGAPSANPGPAIAFAGDTTPERRKAFEYSDAYFTRLTIHRYASYATLPLFVASFASGSQLFDGKEDAPGWARAIHGPAAGGVATLFAVNTVTGGLNLWEARKDPDGRTRRTIHGLLMLAADGGFAATGLLAGEAEESGSRREAHRAVALSSMGVALVSYAIMLPWFGGGR
ncbi:MAG TPA: hypothetical protein VFJ82_10975 [Longimicrobium sp.]|nr:hypothetical protein [Longimicrobium sp.]